MFLNMEDKKTSLGVDLLCENDKKTEAVFADFLTLLSLIVL